MLLDEADLAGAPLVDPGQAEGGRGCGGHNFQLVGQLVGGGGGGEVSGLGHSGLLGGEVVGGLLGGA